ncbi:probable palmitoyltransferase ZDHHC1 [Galendromus occidentalis]|uniref:Palmitoyltransferase n=1 Tax=Galendromus occidentalis TaxID=34638 RepID=A0AAJ6QY51_9ACAR|nr:probable palmitoyltransferase ZDHHC1 [Galendromus occidentalis]
MSKFSRSCLNCCRRVLDYRLNPQMSLGPDQWYRRNGFSLPLHPFQLAAWFMLGIFLFLYYTALIPNVSSSCAQRILIIVMTVGVSIHILSHVVCMAINPADYSVLAKNFQGRRPFDRSKHKHVIENQYCYICETRVGAKSKHCSACNKCIGEFDHHCKWLNNCVGVRNYRWFLLCVISALFCSLLIVGLSGRLFFEHSISVTDLKRAAIEQNNCEPFVQHSNCTLSSVPVIHRFFASSRIDYKLYVFILLTTIILSLAATLLLTHLLFFHIFLWKKKMSTYEYIVSKRDTLRHQQDQLGYTERTVCCCFKRKQKINQIRPSSLANVEDTIRPDNANVQQNSSQQEATQAPQQFDMERIEKENLARKASSSHSQVSRMASNKSHTSSVITQDDLKRKGSFAAGDVYIGTPTAEVMVADEISRRSASLHRQESLQRQDSLQRQESLPQDPPEVGSDRPGSLEGSRSGRSISQLSLNKNQYPSSESVHLPIEADVVICQGDSTHEALSKGHSMMNLLPQNSADSACNADEEELNAPSEDAENRPKRRNHDSGYSEKTKRSPKSEEIDEHEKKVDPLMLKAMERAMMRPQTLPVTVSPLIGNNLSPVNA